MESSKFNGTYEYMGFVIVNNGSKHEWDIEPLEWDIKAIQNFKYKVDVWFKTLASAKKWIKANGENFKEEDFL